MTDWSVYEFDDIVLEEFGESGDHTVPQLGIKCVDDCVTCSKKLAAVTLVKKSSVGKCAAKDFLEKKEISFPALDEPRSPTLKKATWSCEPDVVFSDFCDIESTKEKEMTGLGSEGTKVSGICFKSSNVDNEFRDSDTILGSKASPTDGSIYHFPVGDISPTHSDIELFSNEREDKDSNFLSYYDWPDIGNFEEVDRMFRSCDSTFGQGTTITSDDELSWFTSSICDIDGSEDALRTGLKSTYPELGRMKHQEPDLRCIPVSATSEAIDTEKELGPNTNIKGLQNIDDNSKASLGYSYGDMLDENAKSEQVSVSNEQHLEKSSNTKQKRMEYKLTTSPQHSDIAKAASSVQDGVVGHSDVVMGMRDATGVSFGVVEDSGINYMLSDESSEATSLRQLQYVMEKLDVKTKLCIRDSLYRLARSAEQRNNIGNSNNYIWDGKDKGGMLTIEEPNKRTEYVDLETDTNPIDRSIAHLLFHRPTTDSVEGALPTTCQNVGCNQLVMAGKLDCQEEGSGGEADTNLSTTTDHLVRIL